jgi:parallel beta-helix repeat protein
VHNGTYYEGVEVNKTVYLIGEGRVVTIIDGYEVDVTANNVAVSGFAIGGFTAFAEGKKGNGIRLQAVGCTIDNNTIFNASPYGVWLLNSNNNVISNNVMIANDNNVMLTESSNNTISQNYIGSIEWEGGIRLVYGGIELYQSSNNTITQNNVTQCRRAIRMEGVIPPGELQSDSSNNTIIDNNIEHWECGISLSRCSNNTILENDITYSGRWMIIEDFTGVSLYRSFNNMIIKNNIEQNGEGVKLADSSLNNITDNNLTENFYGMLLQGSQVNSLIGNNIAHSPMISEGSNETRRVGIGILISHAYYSNLLRNNSIAGYMYNFGMENGYYFQDIDASNTVDGKPIYYWINRQNSEIPSDAGYVAIANSTNIRVEGLDLRNNYQGILIANSNDLTIRHNNVTNNRYGIRIESSLNNSTIYHNNLINNTDQVGFWDESLENVWDNGYPSGGNYWSNYTGVDIDDDGIGDTAHTIDANNTDKYPLMGMFSDFNATSECCVQTICNSSISGFQSNGTSISFNVTGEDGTVGFCRICIPTALMNAIYKVFVNGTEVPYILLPCSNSTQSYLYFNYTHSTEEVTITPEFPSFLILPLFMIATLLAVIAYRRRQKRLDQWSRASRFRIGI